MIDFQENDMVMVHGQWYIVCEIDLSTGTFIASTEEGIANRFLIDDVESVDEWDEPEGNFGLGGGFTL